MKTNLFIATPQMEQKSIDLALSYGGLAMTMSSSTSMISSGEIWVAKPTQWESRLEGFASYTDTETALSRTGIFHCLPGFDGQVFAVSISGQTTTAEGAIREIVFHLDDNDDFSASAII